MGQGGRRVAGEGGTQSGRGGAGEGGDTEWTGRGWGGEAEWTGQGRGRGGRGVDGAGPGGTRSGRGGAGKEAEKAGSWDACILSPGDHNISDNSNNSITFEQ